MTFEQLVDSVVHIHRKMCTAAVSSVNSSLSLRNWLIGAYITEFEMLGEDRAAYGDKLFVSLSFRLETLGVPNCNKSRLYRYRDFYKLYPQIVATLSPQFHKLFETGRIRLENQTVGTPSPQSLDGGNVISLPLAGQLILERLSYSHIELLLEFSDSLKRAFYEIECINGNWSVRELKRQIASLYFERSQLSRNKAKLAEFANNSALRNNFSHVIRDPYVFEFLGLRPQEVMPESNLEAALLEKLEDFLLELGHGFCFEARQKRLIIGGEPFYVDLVFYHRILKCHVLVELKVDEFRHEHIGQLNTYVSYYQSHEKTTGDQPPVGILLCTGKNQALVEYALAGMDNHLFVSKYQFELPNAGDLQRYLDEQRQLLEGSKPQTGN